MICMLFLSSRNILIRQFSFQIKQPTEEQPSKAPNIQTSNSSNIKDNSSQRDFQSPSFTRTKAKSLIEIDTETPRTKESKTITPIQKKHSNTASWKQTRYCSISSTSRLEGWSSSLRSYKFFRLWVIQF